MGSSIRLSTNLNVSGSYVFIMGRYPSRGRCSEVGTLRFGCSRWLWLLAFLFLLFLLCIVDGREAKVVQESLLVDFLKCNERLIASVGSAWAIDSGIITNWADGLVTCLPFALSLWLTDSCNEPSDKLPWRHIWRRVINQNHSVWVFYNELSCCIFA